ncbi:hypothetical protein [Bradyrhizobium sp.]|uniref:hypothetical protein n=1 Tax=Bradyrhizobium sp. TaxID=376 RepID=UPI002612814B|nr:hypothetical protein [Bradyrhizobium sp.]
MAHVGVEAKHQIGVRMLLNHPGCSLASHQPDRGITDIDAVDVALECDGNEQTDAMVGSEVRFEAPRKGALQHKNPVLKSDNGAGCVKIIRLEWRRRATAEYGVGTIRVGIVEVLGAQSSRWLQPTDRHDLFQMLKGVISKPEFPCGNPLPAKPR